jgi:hypothetical protein
MTHHIHRSLPVLSLQFPPAVSFTFPFTLGQEDMHPALSRCSTPPFARSRAPRLDIPREPTRPTRQVQRLRWHEAIAYSGRADSGQSRANRGASRSVGNKRLPTLATESPDKAAPITQLQAPVDEERHCHAGDHHGSGAGQAHCG